MGVNRKFQRYFFSFQNCWDLTELDIQIGLSTPSYGSLVTAPRCLCLARTLQGKLLTRQFLKGIGVIQDNTCVLCMQQLKQLIISNFRALMQHGCWN